jgi:hypothetical protein
MSDFKAIRILKFLLKNKDRWELVCFIQDEFAYIGEKANTIASQRLKNASLLFLWQRYKKWRKEDHSEQNSDDYFHTFIADVAFDLALDYLSGVEKIIFEENCYFHFKFINL